MRYTKKEVMERVKGRLIASCQAQPGEPLYIPEPGKSIMYLMARAAKEGGAAAIRAESVRDIAAIKKETALPVFGIIKIHYPGFDSYITPSMKEIDQLAALDTDVIALDCTRLKRGDGIQPADFIYQIRHKYPALVLMADISDFEEGISAWKAGVDFLSTTMSGYTPYTQDRREGPDFQLVQELSQAVDIPVIAEGRIHSPEDAVRAYQSGAFSIVVGGAISRPKEITGRFAAAIDSWREENSEQQ